MASMNPTLGNYIHDALDRIEHTSTIAVYSHSFATIQGLLLQVQPWLPEAYIATRFVYGLRPEYQMFVLRFRPTTVLAAHRLATIYEESIGESEVEKQTILGFENPDLDPSSPLITELGNFLHDNMDQLTHTTSVEVLFHRFETIKSFLASAKPWLPEYYFAERFVYCLQAEYQKFVFKFHPVTVQAAYRLAWIYEESLYLHYFPEAINSSEDLSHECTNMVGDPFPVLSADTVNDFCPATEETIENTVNGSTVRFQSQDTPASLGVVVDLYGNTISAMGGPPKISPQQILPMSSFVVYIQSSVVSDVHNDEDSLQTSPGPKSTCNNEMRLCVTKEPKVHPPDVVVILWNSCFSDYIVPEGADSMCISPSSVILVDDQSMVTCPPIILHCWEPTEKCLIATKLIKSTVHMDGSKWMTITHQLMQCLYKNMVAITLCPSIGTLFAIIQKFNTCFDPGIVIGSLVRVRPGILLTAEIHVLKNGIFWPVARHYVCSLGGYASIVFNWGEKLFAVGTLVNIAHFLIHCDYHVRQELVLQGHSGRVCCTDVIQMDVIQMEKSRSVFYGRDELVALWGYNIASNVELSKEWVQFLHILPYSSSSCNKESFDIYSTTSGGHLLAYVDSKYMSYRPSRKTIGTVQGATASILQYIYNLQYLCVTYDYAIFVLNIVVYSVYPTYYGRIQGNKFQLHWVLYVTLNATRKTIFLTETAVEYVFSTTHGEVFDARQFSYLEVNNSYHTTTSYPSSNSPRSSHCLLLDWTCNRVCDFTNTRVYFYSDKIYPYSLLLVCVLKQWLTYFTAVHDASPSLQGILCYGSDIARLPNFGSSVEQFVRVSRNKSVRQGSEWNIFNGISINTISGMLRSLNNLQRQANIGISLSQSGHTVTAEAASLILSYGMGSLVSTRMPTKFSEYSSTPLLVLPALSQTAGQVHYLRIIGCFCSTNVVVNPVVVWGIWSFDRGIDCSKLSKFRVVQWCATFGNSALSLVVAATYQLDQPLNLQALFVLHANCPPYWHFYLLGELKEELATMLTDNLKIQHLLTTTIVVHILAGFEVCGSVYCILCYDPGGIQQSEEIFILTYSWASLELIDSIEQLTLLYLFLVLIEHLVTFMLDNLHRGGSESNGFSQIVSYAEGSKEPVIVIALGLIEESTSSEQQPSLPFDPGGGTLIPPLWPFKSVCDLVALGNSQNYIPDSSVSYTQSFLPHLILEDKDHFMGSGLS
ncbi:4-aminobutyrate--pyruvate transaminase [Ranunculus cassubicifolius]